ncbi:hypothetical protein F7R12_30255 [Pseudomonas tolaasii]|nr:hypothetical protein F7R12_30255 [Pseudomonas tolaasii]
MKSASIIANAAGFCGSWLACDAGTSVHQVNPGDAIAGKPAPTSKLHWFSERIISAVSCGR